VVLAHRHNNVTNKVSLVSDSQSRPTAENNTWQCAVIAFQPGFTEVHASCYGRVARCGLHLTLPPVLSEDPGEVFALERG
jgi:hypothetical protein